MIDDHKFQRFLKANKLSAEEYWFLKRMLILEPQSIVSLTANDPESALLEFSQLSKEYETEARIGKDSIDWVSVAVDLESRGFVDIFARTDDTILLKHVKVTDKFKGLFVVSDVEKAFLEFYNLYPTRIKFQKGGQWYPSMSGKLENFVDMYSKIILGGNDLLKHERFMLITKMYLDDVGYASAPYKMENYFEVFESIAKEYESGDANSDSDNSRSQEGVDL